MARTNNGKPKNVSPEDRDKKTRQEAQELYERGVGLRDIGSQLDVSYDDLNQWRFIEQWEVLPVEIPKDTELATTTEKTLAVSNDDLSLSTIEANEKLLSGYRLIAKTAEEAVLNDNLKCKDKKQATDTLIASLKGQVDVLGVDLSQQFLLDVAQIIREEVQDEETLKRLGTRLVAIGRLYNARIGTQRS